MHVCMEPSTRMRTPSVAATFEVELHYLIGMLSTQVLASCCLGCMPACSPCITMHASHSCIPMRHSHAAQILLACNLKLHCSMLLPFLPKHPHAVAQVWISFGAIHQICVGRIQTSPVTSRWSECVCIHAIICNTLASFLTASRCR